MAKNRELLGIDPRTIVAGCVRHKDDFVAEECPLAKGRDGSWFYQASLVSEAFGIRNLKGDTFGPKMLVKGFSEKVRDIYNKIFCAAKDEELIALGLAAEVINERGIKYNPYDLALWRKIGEYDGLESVFQLVPYGKNGFWTTGERLK